jgi:hypothetical protein
MPASKQTKKRPRSKSPGATNALPSAGYLLTCDAPTKQYIKAFNESKSADKKFIIEDLDPTHLLVKEKAREEILRKVEEWMDAVSYFCKESSFSIQCICWLIIFLLFQNVFSNIERVGENLET